MQHPDWLRGVMRAYFKHRMCTATWSYGLIWKRTFDGITVLSRVCEHRRGKPCTIHSAAMGGAIPSFSWFGVDFSPSQTKWQINEAVTGETTGGSAETCRPQLMPERRNTAKKNTDNFELPIKFWSYIRTQRRTRITVRWTAIGRELDESWTIVKVHLRPAPSSGCTVERPSQHEGVRVSLKCLNLF